MLRPDKSLLFGSDDLSHGTPMGEVLTILLFCGAAMLAVAAFERFRLRRFWSRRCTGAEWRRAFPTAPKAEIWTFLDLVLSAFAFSQSKRLCLSPNDQIMALYQALYPSLLRSGDAMELETFAISFQEHYGVDPLPVWREDITLGQLFSYATKGS